MDISVVVTCYNEEKNIACCIESLLNQDYAGGAYEIVVSDGGSGDATQAIIGEYVRQSGRVRCVVEPKKGTAAGRNAGIRAASFGRVAFIDADCEAPAEWLSVLARGFRDATRRSSAVAAVGGRNIAPRGSSAFVLAIELALDSFAGSFGSIQGRQYAQARYVPSVAAANALYDREKLLDAGGFDESLASEAEDADLNYRLLSAGYAFMYLPDSFVWHNMRATPRLWMKNMFRYGKGRARLLKRHPGMRSFMYALPIVFLASMAAVPAGFYWRGFFVPLAYFPAIAVYALWHAARKKSCKRAGMVALVYIIQHFAYAAGEAYGLIKVKGKR